MTVVDIEKLAKAHDWLRDAIRYETESKTGPTSLRRYFSTTADKCFMHAVKLETDAFAAA